MWVEPCANECKGLCPGAILPKELITGTLPPATQFWQSGFHTWLFKPLMIL